LARGRAVRGGLLAEVVASLALLMFAATFVVAVVLVAQSESRLRGLLGRSLRLEARVLPDRIEALPADADWWRIDREGRATPAVPGAQAALDPATRSLAEAARRDGAALVRPGAPWEAIRFATPAPGGAVLAARLPVSDSVRLRAAPLALVGGLLVLDVLAFTAFGASLLRRRVVAPLERLAAAARALAEGGFEARVPVEGPREAALVAASFNAMSEALARRTAALEKAVADLRDANAALRVARTGLDRTQRLAAVGRLSAGVAHEVGNPLAALLAFLDLAARDRGISEATRGHLARAAEQGERVRRILRQLLDFARPQRMEPKTVRLPAVAEEAAALVRAQRRYASVQLGVEVVDAPPDAWADPGAAAQIVLNLLLNAADAVVAAGGGPVRVTVRPAVLAARGGESRAAAAERRTPDAVECQVADAGTGIAEEDRERLFDPFFTTKPPGEGTGLGLANSLRLTEELGGALELVEPPPGFRTAFSLRLPAFARPATDCAVRSELRGGEPGAGSGVAAETQH
jgi:two-component system NtrC family sensor kinase